jgi:hypothetical protein
MPAPESDQRAGMTISRLFTVSSMFIKTKTMYRLKYNVFFRRKKHLIIRLPLMNSGLQKISVFEMNESGRKKAHVVN